MFSRTLRIAPACFIFIHCGLTYAVDPSESRDQIVKEVKSAVVLIATPAGEASGVCIGPSGLFITSEHVVEKAGADGAVALIVDSGLASEQTYRAMVVRRDKTLGLALLRMVRGVPPRIIRQGIPRAPTTLPTSFPSSAFGDDSCWRSRSN